jgi:hypothetical protein
MSGVPPEVAGVIFICPFCEHEVVGRDLPYHFWNDHPHMVRKDLIDADGPPCGNRRPHGVHHSPPRENPDDYGWDWCPGIAEEGSR